MSNLHDLALFILTGGCAACALLIADAADVALRAVPALQRRRTSLLMPKRRIIAWAGPVALLCVSLSFLGAMAASGAVLVGVLH